MNTENSLNNEKRNANPSKIRTALSSFFKKRGTVRAVSVGLALTMTAGVAATLFTGCGTSYDNESTTLILGTEAVDGAFNPFFYTSGTDGEMVGMTQIGMLSSDEEGQPLAGKDEACVSLAYGVHTVGNTNTSRTNDAGDDDGYYTEYYFAIKDGIYFSDGVELTINDVLFNMYMYLDPAYSGSSTMYSVDIKGLSAYRTQSYDEAEQEAFDDYFSNEAQTRINAITAWCNNNQTGDWNSLSETTQKDINQAHSLFEEELNSDWNAAEDLVETYKKYGFTQGWEIFLWEYGLITITTTKNLDGTYTYKINYNDYDTKYEHTQTALVSHVYEYMLGEQSGATKAYKTNLANIVTYYATASNLRSYLKSAAMTDYFSDPEHEFSITTVSGITTYQDSKIYNDADSGTETIDLGGTYDILKIVINGVDPKAIQNFSFTVAPGHYYANNSYGDYWKNFSLTSGQENFGVPFADVNFMTAVKNITVPVGAGAYRASTKDGCDADVIPSKNDFLSNNIIYFERFDDFMLGKPVIKKISYQVVSSSTMYDNINSGGVHFATPQATSDTIAKLEGQDKSSLGYVLTDNLGYGYIGINANYVHDIKIRRAIMYAMNTELCVDYYGSNYASVLYRSMSKTLKSYYEYVDDTPYYKDYIYDYVNGKYVYNEEKAKEEIKALAEDAGYKYIDTSTGLLKNSDGETLKYTFTIAGDTDDHPAYNMMIQASELLNSCGFDTTVVTDAAALSKLTNGTLAVWAAAWSSSSDPDMYQVYHKNSSATSVNAWGYPYLLSEGTQDEIDILDELADLIEEGREYTAVSSRGPIYAKALNLVMKLAVELPTYQRKALYVYKKGVIDPDSLYQSDSAFKSPLSEIWNVSFLEG